MRLGAVWVKVCRYGRTLYIKYAYIYACKYVICVSWCSSFCWCVCVFILVTTHVFSVLCVCVGKVAGVNGVNSVVVKSGQSMQRFAVGTGWRRLRLRWQRHCAKHDHGHRLGGSGGGPNAAAGHRHVRIGHGHRHVGALQTLQQMRGATDGDRRWLRGAAGARRRGGRLDLVALLLLLELPSCGQQELLLEQKRRTHRSDGGRMRTGCGRSRVLDNARRGRRLGGCGCGGYGGGCRN